jgi:HSP20 family protein
MAFALMRSFEPLFDVKEFGDRMGRMFGRLPGTADFWRGAGFPAVNIEETADGYVLEAELPGMKLEDLEVLVRQNEVTLRGERKAAADEGRVAHRRERTFGKFERNILLPMPVAAEKVEARLIDGVLTVKLPKTEEAKPRKIEVKVG